jgi:hypothetical protein
MMGPPRGWGWGGGGTQQPGPGGPAPSGTAKNDAALAPTVSASAIRLHKKFGASLVHFVNNI